MTIYNLCDLRSEDAGGGDGGGWQRQDNHRAEHGGQARASWENSRL